MPVIAYFPFILASAFLAGSLPGLIDRDFSMFWRLSFRFPCFSWTIPRLNSASSTYIGDSFTTFAYICSALAYSFLTAWTYPMLKKASAKFGSVSPAFAYASSAFGYSFSFTYACPSWK